MPVFAYTTVDLEDRETAGTLIAETPADGRQHLRERGLSIVRFAPAREMRSRSWPGIGAHHRRQEQVAEFARYLAMLLKAGLELPKSLTTLARECERQLATTLKEVHDRVTGGESLADALSAHPRWFDPLFVSAVRVGELSGNLDESLSELAEHLRAQRTLRNELTNALTYPLILVCVGVAVVLFLMTFVVPQLITVLAASGRPLPTSTALLKGFSDLLVNHWAIVVLVLGILIAAGTLIYRSDPGRRAWHRVQLRLPLAGPLIRKSLIAQFAQRMSLLLKTGIPFVEAATTVAGLSRNRVLAGELATLAHSVESGSDIAPAMEGSLIFPPMVVQLVAVGQDSGELPEMLAELRTRYETEVRLATTRFTAALEPLLIVLLAAAVGFVVFACLMPILEVTRAIA